MGSRLSAGKSTLLESGLWSAIGGVVAKIFSIPLNIVVASILGPYGYGVISIVSVAVQYLGHLNLGMLSNLAREVPLAYGRNDKEEARKIYGVVAGNYITTTIIGLVALWAVYIYEIDLLKGLTGTHMLLLTMIVLASNYHSYYYNVIKGEGQFIVYGQYELFNGVVVPLVTVLLVWWLNINGKLIAMLVASIASGGFLYIRLARPKIRPHYDWSLTKLLMSTGIMMYFNRIVDGVFISISIVIAGSFLSTDQIGLLGFTLAFASVNKLPLARMLQVAVARQMAVDGGEHGLEDKTIFRRYFEKPYIVYLYLLSLMMGGVLIVYSFVIPRFMPEYAAVMPLLLLIFAGMTFFNARYFAYSYINVTRQMNKRTAILFVGLIANTIGSFVALRYGHGIYGVTMSVAISMVLISVQTIVFTFQQVFRSKKKSVVFIAKLFTLCALSSMALWMIVEGVGFPERYFDQVVSELAVEVFKMLFYGVTFIIMITVLYSILFVKERFLQELYLLTSTAVSMIIRGVGGLSRSV